jgi:pyridoxamine 5'-phosphate oxidase
MGDTRDRESLSSAIVRKERYRGACGGVAASLAAPDRQTVEMEEASVDPDPINQLSLWLEVARGAGEPMPEAMAVATATTEGRPSSRMVLLRGIDSRGLVFYTDQESGKGQELKANPFAAALFHWFKPVHRQVRVTGAVEVVDASLSDTYWQSRPPASRRSAVASHQSQVTESRAVLEEGVAKLAETFPDDLGPPRPLRWGGYRIRPDVVELWEEGADRLHDRLRYRAQSGNWRIERLSP